jgi:hypothetical protein
MFVWLRRDSGRPLQAVELNAPDRQPARAGIGCVVVEKGTPVLRSPPNGNRNYSRKSMIDLWDFDSPMKMRHTATVYKHPNNLLLRQFRR